MIYPMHRIELNIGSEVFASVLFNNVSVDVSASAFNV